RSTMNALFNFVNYKSNGDVSFFQGDSGNAGNRSGWFTLPLISKGIQSFTEFDTVIDGERQTNIESWRHAGEGDSCACSWSVSDFNFKVSPFMYRREGINHSFIWAEIDWMDRSTGFPI